MIRSFKSSRHSHLIIKKPRGRLKQMIIFVICVVIVFLEVLIIYPILVINSRITRKEEQKEGD